MGENAPDHSWSLTLALRSIADRAGYEIALDDLHAALGLPVLVCAVPAERRLACWSMYARDVFLTRAARVFGITLRAVHPPEAARGLNRADEFRQHFDASYRPLIERALENGQPVLAWQGWPGDHGNAWGIITRRCDDGVGFAGTIISSPSPRAGSPPTRDGATARGSDSGEVTLTSPPPQLYVVETVTPTVPGANEVFTLALDHARSVLNNEPGERFGVVMGPAAFDEWIARLKQSETGEDGSVGGPRLQTWGNDSDFQIASPISEEMGHPPSEEMAHPSGATGGLPASASRSAEDLAADHWLLAASVVAGHRAMLRFLRRHGDDAGADRAELIDSVVSTCRVVVSELGEPTDSPATRKRIETSAGRAELTDKLTRAREACERLRDALASQRTSKN